MKKVVFLLAAACLALNLCAQTQSLVFSKSGVGPLKAGAKMTNQNGCVLPASVDGFYDRVFCDANQFTGETEIICYKDDNPVLLVACNDADKAVAFSVLSANCSTAEGLSLNNTAAEIMAAGAVRKSAMEPVQNALYLNGVWFFFRESDGAPGKLSPSAKPWAMSNVNYTILEICF